MRSQLSRGTISVHSRYLSFLDASANRASQSLRQCALWPEQVEFKSFGTTHQDKTLTAHYASL